METRTDFLKLIGIFHLTSLINVVKFEQQAKQCTRLVKNNGLLVDLSN